MGKIKITYLVLIIGLFLSSCSTAYRFGYKSSEYGQDIVPFGKNLMGTVKGYAINYNKSPQSVDDLIIYVERVIEASIATDLDSSLYKYLKDNREDLIFRFNEDNSEFRIYYKKINNWRMVLSDGLSTTCGDIRRFDWKRVSFFDELGYIFWNESLRELVHIRIHEINKKYLEEWSKNDYYITIVEYTLTGFNNLCTNESIDITQSDWYKELYEFLDSIAKEYGISRMVFRNYISGDNDTLNFWGI